MGAIPVNKVICPATSVPVILADAPVAPAPSPNITEIGDINTGAGCTRGIVMVVSVVIDTYIIKCYFYNQINYE
jgi:hypothetical protein